MLGRDAAPSTQRPPQVKQQLDIQNKAITQLSEVIEQLRIRLDPILSNENPPPAPSCGEQETLLLHLKTMPAAGGPVQLQVSWAFMRV